MEFLVICTPKKISVRETGRNTGEIVAAEATYPITEFKEFYIGGAPQELRERC